MCQILNARLPVGKLKVEIHPELISSCSLSKKLDSYAIWLALKTIDKNKEGTGKISLATAIQIVHDLFKMNQNYCYEMIKKGADIFWSQPSGKKGEKIIYLYSINKIVEKFPFNLAKTKPFLIKMNDLFSFDSSNEVKTFLSGFVIARYGQNKPISLQSLQDNLGVSKSTLKRRINNSYIITVKNNYCYFNEEFQNMADAFLFIKKSNFKFKNLRIIKRENKFIIARQIANSYSIEDFSRIKISKRPKVFKSMDSINKDYFQTRKFVNKSKSQNVSANTFVKVKTENENFHVWKLTSKRQRNRIIRYRTWRSIKKQG